MADKLENKTSPEAGEAQDVPSAEGQVELSDAVPMEDFRKFQSVKDREVAEAKRQAEALQRRLEQMEQQFETLIDDPEQRAEYQRKRLESQLEVYRQRDVLAQQRKWFTEQYGVPQEVLVSEDPRELTLAAMNWLNEQRQQATAPDPKKDKAREVEKLEEEGGHDVSISPGTPPERQRMAEEDLENRIAELRQVAQRGGSAGNSARVEILKLEAQRQRQRASRARL